MLSSYTMHIVIIIMVYSTLIFVVYHIYGKYILGIY